MTIVLERMDESLVVLSRYLGWSLADVVAASSRKSQSKHPSPSEWNTEVVAEIRKKLVAHGEYQVYDASVKKLESRIKSLVQSAKPTLSCSDLPTVDRSLCATGFNISTEVVLLKQVRDRVSKVITVTPVSRRALESLTELM
jgi:ribosomal protein L17